MANLLLRLMRDEREISMADELSDSLNTPAASNSQEELQALRRLQFALYETYI